MWCKREMIFMSSPRRAVRTARIKKPKRPPLAPARGRAVADVSNRAKSLARDLERELGAGRIDSLSDDGLQQLMAALCKIYGRRVEGGAKSWPLSDQGGVSPTEVMVTASGLLKAADLQVFELGMWQSWTGR